MTDELVFTIDGATATSARRVSLASAGLAERSHLQEWVLAHPEILGVDAKVVTFEFDRWTNGGPTQAADRLDVLAIDRVGRLVLAELKRDKAPDSTTMQAINYAAMVSRFSLDTLAEVHARFLGNGVTAQDALALLQDWAPVISDETLAPPRIVLLASDFGPTLTNTALFLFEAGIDIRLVRYQLFETGGGERVLSVNQMLPVPNSEDFMIRPRSDSATKTDARVRRERRGSVPGRIVATGALEDGAPLTIAVPHGAQEDRAAIEEWLAGHDDRARVRWRLDSQNPVTWLRDRRVYSLTSLIRIVIASATGHPPRGQVWGPAWFRNQQGLTLAEIADSTQVG